MAQSLVLSIDVYRGLGISPLRVNIWLSFSQANLGAKIDPAMIFFGVFEKIETFSRRFVLIASDTEIFGRVYLKF